MNRWEQYIERKKDQYGSKFDMSDIHQDFLPYLISGEKIIVDIPIDGIKRGWVGVTAGHRPSLLLLTKRSSRSSEYLLTKGCRLVGYMKGNDIIRIVNLDKYEDIQYNPPKNRTVFTVVIRKGEQYGQHSISAHSNN